MRKASPKRDSITELFTKFAGQANTLAIPCPYIDFCNGDHLAALLLSQILYWADRTDDPDGWFAKSYEDWYKETRLTKRQIMRIIGKDKRQKEGAFSLKAVGIETAVKRSKHYEGQAAMRYRVDFEVLSQHVLDYISGKVTNAHSGKVTNGNSLEVTNAHSSEVTKGNSYITKTTAKTIAKVKAPAPDPFADSMNTQYAAYLDAWRNAHQGVKPLALRGRERTDAIDDVKDLIEMGVTVDDLTAFTQERQAKGKSTVWKFMVKDIHEFMTRKQKRASIAASIPTINGNVVYIEALNKTLIWNDDKSGWDEFDGKHESRPA